MKLSSTLTNYDGSGLYEFTAKCFDAEHLGVGVPTILGRAHSFLMCHSGPRVLVYSESAAGTASFLGAAFFFGAAFFLAAPIASILICV